MKKIISLIIFSIILFSCNNESRLIDTYVCNCKEQKELQLFIKQSIKNANNMSDEEMEDVIQKLYVVGIKSHCKLLPVWKDNNGNVDWKKQNIDSCFNIMKIYY